MKRILLPLLCLLILALALPGAAQASAGFKNKGSKNVTAAPTGGDSAAPAEVAAMPDAPTDAEAFGFEADTGTISDYTGSEVDVVIPREIDGVPVRRISRNAFEACRDYTDTDILNNRSEWIPLRSLVVPETVEEIEDGAFAYCQQLESFVCYAPLESSGRAAFQLCRGLKNVVYVNGVGLLDNYLFDHCDSLELVFAGPSCRAVGEGAFGFTGLRELTLSAESIAARAVHDCPDLEALRLTANVRQVENYAFAGNERLRAVYFGGTDALCSEMLVGAAPEVTVFLPEDASAEAEATAARLCAWSGAPSTVTVVRQNVEIDAETRPDLSALHGTGPIEVPKRAPGAESEPEPEPEPEPAAPAPEGNGLACVGTWALTSVEMDGETYEPAALGMEITMQLNADGTADLVASGETTPGTWTFDNGRVVVSDGATEPMAFEVADDLLTADMGDGIMVFTRTDSIEGPETEPEPDPVPDPEPAPIGAGAPDYAGEWFLSRVDYDGDTYTPADFGLSASMQLNADGSAALINDSEAAEGSWRLEGDSVVVNDGSYDMAFTLRDGALAAETDSLTLYFSREAPEAPAATPAPQAADPLPGEFVDDWQLTGLARGETVSSAADFGMDYTLRLNADGTAQVIQAGTTTDAVWRFADGKLRVIADGAESVFTPEDGALTSDGGFGLTMILERTAPAGGGLAGTWHGVYLDSGILTGDPRALWGLDITLTLNEDGTGSLDYGGPDEGMYWYRDEAADAYYYGADPSAPGTPLALREDGFLIYGTEAGGYIIFSADADAEWDPDAGLAPVPAPAPTEAPAPEADAKDWLERRFVCASAEVSGVTLDAAALGGEYAVVFHADGTADFTMAGAAVADLPWTEGDASLTVDYYGTPLLFAFSEAGLDLDYFGSMRMTFVPEE